MSKTPIDALMDAVEWEIIPGQVDSADIPVATHRGVLRIGDCELEVFQLSDGQRVISAESVNRFFGGER